MELPAPLPVLAAIAGAGGWLLGHRAAAAEAAATPTPGAPAPKPGGDATSPEWAAAQLQWGDQGTGAGTLNGVLPGSNPGGTPVGDGGGLEPPPAPAPPPPSSSPPPSGNLASLVAAYGPKPPGAVGAVSLVGVRLYTVNTTTRVATLWGSSKTVRAWVSGSAVYRGSNFSQATLRRILSGGHLGLYCRVDDDHFTALT